MSEPRSAQQSPIDILTRWEEHGALWRVSRVEPGGVTIELCSCTGEAMQQLCSDDAELRAYVARRPRSDFA